MSDRIFQNYKGKINGLIGCQLKSLKSLIEPSDRDTVFIWLQTDLHYYRIFIDGAYCGVDQYETDQSGIDEADGSEPVNLDHMVIGESITDAYVESVKLPEIRLTIRLSSGNSLILNCDKDERCTLFVKTVRQAKKEQN